MPDTIERTIYKLEIDDSGYIRGVDALSASTKKFTLEQEAANKVLQANQTNLKNQSAYVQQTKKDLETYTGTNEKYRLQLQKSFSTATADEQKLIDKVRESQKAYDDAAKAAQGFAETSSRASNLQAQTTGGKIPTGPPPGLPAQVSSQIANVLNVPEFTAMAQVVEETKQEFDDLRVSITLAEERMKQLNETDEEFQQLAPIVAKGKEALEQYDKAAKSAGNSQGSLRTQLRQGREDLVKLEQAGKGATAQYFELEKRVAKLTDEFGDQQQRIKILASDTKLLDFGKGAITAATAAFSAYTSISILAGDESEELQKKTMQLFAAMQLLQSLEQLSNLVRREGTLFTLAQSAAQTVYTTVVGASTGALKAFRLALLGTGIGAAIIAIGFLVTKWMEYRDTIKKAGENQKLLNEVVAEGNKEAGKQIADLKLLTKAVQDANQPMKDRLDAVKQLQKEFPDYFGNLSKEAILTGDITTATKLATEAIIAAGRARAAKGKIDALENQQLDLDFEREQLLIESGKELLKIRKQNRDEVVATDEFGNAVAVNTPAEQERASVNRTKEKLADIKDKKETLQRQEEFLTDFVGLSKLTKVVEEKDPDKGKKAAADKKVHEIENEFARKKAELDQRLAALKAKESDDESKIRIEFAQRLAKEQFEIEKLLKEKKVTKPQAEILKAETIEINTVELQKRLDDLHKKQTDARQKLNDELLALQDKNIQDQLNLIQDEFDRRAALIDFNEKKELAASVENTQKRLDALDLQKLLIGEKAYQDAKAEIVAAGEQNTLNIIQKFANDRRALSLDAFKSLLDAYDQAISNADLIRNEDEAKALQSAKEKFLSHEITFEEFQKRITQIQKDANRERRDNDLETLKNQLAALDRQIDETIDKTTKEYADLLALQKKFREKIASDEKEKAKDTDDPAKKITEGNDTFKDRVVAIGQLTDAVIAFWQKTNEAEERALDRSISLQQKRVDAAQKIAERGNAQYLKAEEDRLTELNIKRENAARKQLGIDAALQASQILVGITGAIAKISTPGIGIAETIGAIAVIVGALATGYSLVKSLQGNQPKLYEGTPHLERGAHPRGRDTIPAWLNEGEAVIPTEKNKKYKKAVEAIYHGKVPAEELNNFVENYVRNNTVKNFRTDKTENKTETSTYNRFVQNISRIPARELNNFINTYEKKEVKKYFQGTTDVKARETPSIPKWLEQGKPVKAKNFTETKEAILKGRVPADVVSDFVENYVKNKTEKDLIDRIQKVYNETTDKKITVSQVKELLKSDSFVNNYSKKTEDRKLFNTVQSVTDLVRNKLENIKTLSYDKTLSEKVDKVFSENKNLVENKNVLELARKVSMSVTDSSVSFKKVDSFINSYLKNIEERKTFDINRAVTELVSEKIDKKSVSLDTANKLTNENVSVSDVKKYSQVIDRVINENKELSESKDVFEIARKVINEVSDKNVGVREFSSFINNYKKEIEDKKTSNVIHSLAKLVSERVENNAISTDFQTSLVNKNLTIDNIQKYSDIVDRVVGQTKSEDVLDTIHRVLDEVTDKKISERQLNEVISKKDKKHFSQIHDKKTANIIDTVSKLVNERIEKSAISSDLQRSLTNENVSIDDVKKYSETVNKVVDIKTKENTYKQFTDNIEKVPAKVLNTFIENYSKKDISSEVIKTFVENYQKENKTKVTDSVLNNFINNYEERKFFRGTPELKGKPGVDQIPIWATKGEAIIPVEKNNIYKPVVEAVFKGTVPPEILNNFVSNYHQIKSVPQPNYQRIKEAAELKITQDGKMSVAISEQNKLIMENNDLQRKTINTLKKLGVNVSLDQRGFAVTQMEVIEQMKRDKHI